MKYGSSKKTLILIKSIEEDGWQDLTDLDHTQIPPLGTVNEDLDYTSEVDKTSTILGNYLRSQGVKGSFEMIFAKTTLSFSDEPEKVDVQDLNVPKDYARGYDTYSGSLEIIKKKAEHRFEGAVDGGWKSNLLEYYPFDDFRIFEIWTLENPDYMDLRATKCDLLTKHIAVVLDSLEKSIEAPLKITIPLSRRTYRRFPNWSEPTQTSLLTDDDLTGTPGDPTDPTMHTRLELSVTGAAETGLKIEIEGYNILGEPITEAVVPVADVGTKEYLTKKYFERITSLAYTGFTGGTLTIKDYDYKIQ